MTDHEFKYWAFLNYSHQDNGEQRSDPPAGSRLCWGNWLGDALKTFSIPTEFVGQLNGRGETIPERLAPIFRPEPDLPDEATLSADIRAALEQSRCLIVICSPRSAKSRQVNETVCYFKQQGRSQYILAIVVAGEPNASHENKPGWSPDDECLVPALRHPVLPDGTLDTTRRAGRFVFVDARQGVDKREVLANDHRTAQADLEMAKIHLIALLLGVGFNGLWWREQKRHFYDLAEAQHQAREALNQVAEVQRQLQETQSQARAAQNKALEMQHLPDDVHAQIQEAQHQVQAAQNQTRAAQQQLQELQNKVRDTQTQLAEARQRSIAAESKVLEAQQQARVAQSQLETTRNQLHAVPPPPDQLAENLHPAQAAHDNLLAAQSQVQGFQNQARLAKTQLEEASLQFLKIQNQARKARRLTRVFALLSVLGLLAAGLAANQALRQRKVASEQAAAESAAEFDLASSRLNPEQIWPLLQNIGGAAPDEKQRRRLDYLAAGIPREQIPETLKSAAVILNDQQRSHFQKWLLIRLSWVNPVSAMTNASVIEGKIVNDAGLSDSCAYFQLAVLDSWMKTDLAGALSWVSQLPDADSRQRALEQISRWLQTQPNSDSNQRTLENWLGELAQTDIVGTLVLANSLPAGAWRNTVIAQLWMQADPLAFWDWINRLNFPPEYLMPPRKAPGLLLNANFNRPPIFSWTTSDLSKATNSPMPIEPQD